MNLCCTKIQPLKKKEQNDCQPALYIAGTGECPDEDELRQDADSFYHSLINSFQLPVISTTNEGIISSWNTATEKLLGYKADEVTGQHISAIISSAYIPKYLEWADNLITNGQPGSIEIIFTHKADFTIATILNGAVIRNARGRITGICLTVSASNKVQKDSGVIAETDEQRLRLSEERYRYLFYNNPLPMWIYDSATLQFIEVNDAAIEKYEYPRKEFLQLGLADIRPNQDTEKLMASVRERKERKFNTAGTWEHITKTGKRLYVEITSHLVQFENKEAVLVLANDVTENKEAGELLLKAYNENTRILESIMDGFFAVDKNWIVTYWNKEAERMLLKSREDILGKNLWDVYNSKEALKFLPEYQRAMKDNVTVHFEEYFPTLQSWLDITAFPSGDGLSIYIKDITERRLADEKLKAAKDRYKMVAQATSDAIYEWDIKENVNHWGEGFETLFGHKWQAGKLPVESWRENLHPDEKEDLLAAANEAFEKKQTSLSRVIRFRCADGSYKTVFDKQVILYNDQNEPVKIVGAMQDITDRKQKETAIKLLNEQLQQRATELSVSNHELERFAYVASHDLQEPLRMVSSFLQLLQRKYKGQLDDSADQYIEFAVDGAERMKKLILDLLEYSRVGTNKDRFTETDAGEAIQTVLKNLTKAIAESGTIVTVSPMPVIRANKMQIVQLFQNLISNALKYNTSSAPQIEAGYEDLGDYWKFFVKDNGIGIEEKFFDKVFIIFQRLHNKSRFSGTGIGLAICKKIVEKHNGTIWIDSAPGIGSTFYFTIKK